MLLKIGRQNQISATVKMAFSAYLAWLPLVVVNAVFVARMDSRVDGSERLLHHLYDGGQILAIAGLAFALVMLIGTFPWLTRRRILVIAFAFAWGLSYVLLYSDLTNFIERKGEHVPWRYLFATGATVALSAAWIVGRSIGRTALWWLASLIGVVVMVVNQTILQQAYPGVHTVLVLQAVTIIAGSLVNRQWHWMSNRRLLWLIGTVSLLSVAAYIVAPGSIVRGELFRSSGAIGARVAARLWMITGSDNDAYPIDPTSPWYNPRDRLPSIGPHPIPGRPKDPIVILLTVDSLRADLLDDKSYYWAVQNLRKLRHASLSFTRAWAPAPATRVSMSSLFSCTYFSQQVWEPKGFGRGKTRRSLFLPSKTKGPRLPALLEKHGVKTINLATHWSLLGKFGIATGFGTEEDLGSRPKSRVLVDAILKQFETPPQGPVFLFSHFMDPHNPYNRGERTGSPKDRYASEVHIVDRSIRRLIGALRRRPFFDRVYLIVSADHGEAFHEHGVRYHGRSLYEEIIHVPLLIRGPGVRNRVVNDPVTLMDIPPTVLDIFRVPTPGTFMGQSLAGYIGGANPMLTRPIAADSAVLIRKFAMLYRGRYKVILDIEKDTQEFYDLKKDPGEKRNLADRPESKRYITDTRAFLRIHASKTGLPR